VRPDLLVDVTEGEPIPDAIPEHVKTRVSVEIEDIGEPMTACFFTKVTSDPTNW
jgi:hypothetical protein